MTTEPNYEAVIVDVEHLKENLDALPVREVPRAMVVFPTPEILLACVGYLSPGFHGLHINMVSRDRAMGTRNGWDVEFRYFADPMQVRGLLCNRLMFVGNVKQDIREAAQLTLRYPK